MTILSNYSLEDCNTFGIAAKAERFGIIQAEQDLFSLDFEDNIRVLGGGSNLLLPDSVEGLVLKNEIKGIEIVAEDDTSVLVEIGGGENWHEFVMWAVEHNYGGVENLSLIPGTVGAAPIQNIGAYGVELKDIFEGLNAYLFDEFGEEAFTPEDCRFGYRDSIFKRELKGKVCITRVYLRLQKAPHKVNVSYGAISKTLEERGISEPSIKDVSDAVIAIRQSKLPDPKEIGNSGSFFKNPEIPQAEFDALLQKFPNAPSYPLPNEMVKVPAGWLIDQCGFKGVRYGNTGCYKNQALVLVNYGGATGKEVYDFSEKVLQTVLEKFGIQLEREVNVW